VNLNLQKNKKVGKNMMAAMQNENPESVEAPSGKNRNTENFPVGSFLIRPDLRQDVHVFYNFARAADDIADHPLLESSEKLRRLTRFEEIMKGGAGDDVPSARAMFENLRENGVDRQHCLDLIRAFKQDAVKRRYANWGELMEYCRYSASPVGRHVLALHGIGEAAWPSNDALCSALQVINHIQDCADDYRTLDRVYLPLDDMAACGANLPDLSREKSSPALRKWIDMQLERLRPMLVAARGLPRNVPDWRLKIETSIICVLGEKLARLLSRRDPLKDNVKLSKFSILTAALHGAARAFL
jgi:squalene synthase HpnC